MKLKNNTFFFKGVPHECRRYSIIQLIGDTLLCTGTFWYEKTQILSIIQLPFCKAGQFTLERHNCFKPKIYAALIKPNENIAPKQFSRDQSMSHPDPQQYDCSGDPLFCPFYFLKQNSDGNHIGHLFKSHRNPIEIAQKSQRNIMETLQEPQRNPTGIPQKFHRNLMKTQQKSYRNPKTPL